MTEKDKILLNALAMICAGFEILSDTKHNLTQESEVGLIYDKLEKPFIDAWELAQTLESAYDFYLRIKKLEDSPA